MPCALFMLQDDLQCQLKRKLHEVDGKGLEIPGIVKLNRLLNQIGKVVGFCC